MGTEESDSEDSLLELANSERRSTVIEEKEEVVAPDVTPAAFVTYRNVSENGGELNELLGKLREFKNVLENLTVNNGNKRKNHRSRSSSRPVVNSPSFKKGPRTPKSTLRKTMSFYDKSNSPALNERKRTSPLKRAQSTFFRTSQSPNKDGIVVQLSASKPKPSNRSSRSVSVSAARLNDSTKIVKPSPVSVPPNKILTTKNGGAQLLNESSIGNTNKTLKRQTINVNPQQYPDSLRKIQPSSPTMRSSNSGTLSSSHQTALQKSAASRLFSRYTENTFDYPFLNCVKYVIDCQVKHVDDSIVSTKIIKLFSRHVSGIARDMGIKLRPSGLKNILLSCKNQIRDVFNDFDQRVELEERSRRKILFEDMMDRFQSIFRKLDLPEARESNENSSQGTSRSSMGSTFSSTPRSLASSSERRSHASSRSVSVMTSSMQSPRFTLTNSSSNNTSSPLASSKSNSTRSTRSSNKSSSGRSSLSMQEQQRQRRAISNSRNGGPSVNSKFTARLTPSSQQKQRKLQSQTPTAGSLSARRRIGTNQPRSASVLHGQEYRNRRAIMSPNTPSNVLVPPPPPPLTQEELRRIEREEKLEEQRLRQQERQQKRRANNTTTKANIGQTIRVKAKNRTNSNSSGGTTSNRNLSTISEVTTFSDKSSNISSYGSSNNSGHNTNTVSNQSHGDETKPSAQISSVTAKMDAVLESMRKASKDQSTMNKELKASLTGNTNRIGLHRSQSFFIKSKTPKLKSVASFHQSNLSAAFEGENFHFDDSPSPTREPHSAGPLNSSPLAPIPFSLDKQSNRQSNNNNNNTINKKGSKTPSAARSSAHRSIAERRSGASSSTSTAATLKRRPQTASTITNRNQTMTATQRLQQQQQKRQQQQQQQQQQHNRISDRISNQSSNSSNGGGATPRSVGGYSSVKSIKSRQKSTVGSSSESVGYNRSVSTLPSRKRSVTARSVSTCRSQSRLRSQREDAAAAKAVARMKAAREKKSGRSTSTMRSVSTMKPRSTSRMRSSSRARPPMSVLTKNSPTPRTERRSNPMENESTTSEFDIPPPRNAVTQRNRTSTSKRWDDALEDDSLFQDTPSVLGDPDNVFRSPTAVNPSRTTKPKTRQRRGSIDSRGIPTSQQRTKQRRMSNGSLISDLSHGGTPATQSRRRAFDKLHADAARRRKQQQDIAAELEADLIATPHERKTRRSSSTGISPSPSVGIMSSRASVNSHLSVSSSVVAGERLYKESQMRRLRQEDAKLDQQKRQMADCTFAPKTNVSKR
eukprot:TRINITY_DN424595_c0_g1_i4.p1 TRINITY_DN424595_c0_g1~~TRINITY_DN424595_c0_g1_i4.p1  ORF type:complete len:1265 (-),score=385.54 TRINITY_DN424595_c0_g1_i4:336-4130(-)